MNKKSSVGKNAFLQYLSISILWQWYLASLFWAAVLWIWRVELWSQVLVAIWQFDIYHDPGSRQCPNKAAGAATHLGTTRLTPAMAPGENDTNIISMMRHSDNVRLTLNVCQCGEIGGDWGLRTACMRSVVSGWALSSPWCVPLSAGPRWIESKQVWDQGRQ